jgi:hypothetical protein
MATRKRKTKRAFLASYRRLYFSDMVKTDPLAWRAKLDKLKDAMRSAGITVAEMNAALWKG